MTECQERQKQQFSIEREHIIRDDVDSIKSQLKLRRKGSEP